jgi:hypothetical protein
VVFALLACDHATFFFFSFLIYRYSNILFSRPYNSCLSCNNILVLQCSHCKNNVLLLKLQGMSLSLGALRFESFFFNFFFLVLTLKLQKKIYRDIIILMVFLFFGAGPAGPLCIFNMIKNN